MATRFPCKSEGWVIFHMLVEKAREKTQFGWFPVKKAVANTGSCGNCDLHMPRAKTIHILEDLTHKTVQVNLPSQKKVIWVLGVLSRWSRGSELQMHKQHPWNGPYPRCGIRKPVANGRETKDPEKWSAKPAFLMMSGWRMS